MFWESESGRVRRNVSTFLPPPVLPQQVVDGGSAPVHAPQHISGASLQVPAQRQAVQVGKQTHLKCGGRATERDSHSGDFTDGLQPLLAENMQNVKPAKSEFGFYVLPDGFGSIK